MRAFPTALAVGFAILCLLWVRNKDPLILTTPNVAGTATESDVLQDLNDMTDEQVAQVYKAIVRESARSARG